MELKHDLIFLILNLYSSWKWVLVFLIVDLCCHYWVALLRMFLPFYSNTNWTSSEFLNNGPVECYLSVFSALHPGRCLDLILLNSMVEFSFKPKWKSVCFSFVQELQFKYSIYFDDFFIADSLKIKRNYFSNFSDNELGIDNSDNRLMWDPLFHWFHRYSIDIVPELYFVIVEMLVMNDSAFEWEYIGEDDSPFMKKHISGLDHSIKHAIEIEAETHGFSDNNIDLVIEIFPW